LDIKGGNPSEELTTWERREMDFPRMKEAPGKEGFPSGEIVFLFTA